MHSSRRRSPWLSQGGWIPKTISVIPNLKPRIRFRPAPRSVQGAALASGVATCKAIAAPLLPGGNCPRSFRRPPPPFQHHASKSLLNKKMRRPEGDSFLDAPTFGGNRGKVLPVTLSCSLMDGPRSHFTPDFGWHNTCTSIGSTQREKRQRGRLRRNRCSATQLECD
jgi:hypothetical protein